MGANHSNTQTMKMTQGMSSKKTVSSPKRQQFQQQAADRKLNFFAGECSGSFNHKNAFEMSWNDETESCFDSVQECSKIEPCKLEDDDLECEVSFANENSTFSESDDCATHQSTSMLSVSFQPVFA